jgi:hypothetical protein
MMSSDNESDTVPLSLSTTCGQVPACHSTAAAWAAKAAINQTVMIVLMNLLAAMVMERGEN